MEIEVTGEREIQEGEGLAGKSLLCWCHSSRVNGIIHHQALHRRLGGKMLSHKVSKGPTYIWDYLRLILIEQCWMR